MRDLIGIYKVDFVFFVSNNRNKTKSFEYAYVRKYENLSFKQLLKYLLYGRVFLIAKNDGRVL